MKVCLGSRIAAAVATVALCLLLASCAQTGPPLPPSLELPKPPTDLRATRKGNRVTLNWSEPTFTTDRQGVRYIVRPLTGGGANRARLHPEMTGCGNPVAMFPRRYLKRRKHQAPRA